jgi:hypothetical protein
MRVATSPAAATPMSARRRHLVGLALEAVDLLDTGTPLAMDAVFRGADLLSVS